MFVPPVIREPTLARRSYRRTRPCIDGLVWCPPLTLRRFARVLSPRRRIFPRQSAMPRSGRPGTHIPAACVYGFRARRSAAPRNDEGFLCESGGADQRVSDIGSAYPTCSGLPLRLVEAKSSSCSSVIDSYID